jgi:4-amino-4-deoxy-L-arabinose transferase-like glycosyltransferase
LPKQTSSKRPALHFILGALFSAATGQAFLAWADQPWTLFPGLLGYALALFFLFRIPGSESPSSPKPLSPRLELALSLLILAVALGLRVYHLDSLPSGMHTDQGLEGQSAQRIAFEGWRPFFEVFNYHVPEIFMYYQLAVWFKLFGSSYQTFHVFFALFALAAFPLAYWTFRQLSGPRVALLSLFLLSAMRWHLIFSRNGFPTIQVPFYLFGALAFWVFGLKKKNPWMLLVASLFCGLGLYTYQSFKAVPLLMLALGLYELGINRQGRPVLRRNLIFFFLSVGLLAAPLVWYMARHESFGNRERELFIGKAVMEQKNLMPVLQVWAGTAMMFNRVGDENPRHNIPGHRMLDDITGIFFVLGFALALRRWKQRDAFYPLAGFCVMSLPCLLSTDIAHANRLLALTPFVAWFAASSMDSFWGETGVKPRFRNWALPLGLFLLLLVCFLNFKTYFVEQAGNDDCWKGYGPEQNFIGRNIETLERQQPGKYDYFLSPAYFGNHTVAFLGYPAGERMESLQIPAQLAPGGWPSDRDAVFVLEEGKLGLLNFLQNLFPDGKLDRLTDRDGRTLVYWFEVSRDSLKTLTGWKRGLQGTYIAASGWNGKPLVVRRDPVLNFTYKGDFPFTDYPPFRIRWTGTLETPRPGNYQFQVLTSDQAQLWLDGKLVPLEKPLTLTAQAHALRLDFEKDGGDAMALHLVWKKPGEDKWEVVPATAFGLTAQMRSSKF